jgi:hypothetical protein
MLAAHGYALDDEVALEGEERDWRSTSPRTR